MSAEYPNPCCRCGFCCLAETCPIGQYVFGIGKHDLCNALLFPDRAFCTLAEKGLVPIGDGCCIKARAYKNGIEYDFASLPSEVKHDVARKLLYKTRRKYAKKKD